MTRWVPFPLRPIGQPWPGLNTRGGKLDPGQGYLEDGSINGIINEMDLLEKRKGMVRGLDERFTGVVCGLFKYTDECGNEYVVVADQDGIQVRQPFNIPSFLGSDSLMNDGFETLDTAVWNNTTDYETFVGALQLVSLAAENDNTNVALDRLMVWFKDSVISSYQAEIQYDFVAGGSIQAATVAIKGSTSFVLVANVSLSGADYTFNIQLVNVSTLARTTLASSVLTGAALADGFLRLSYNAETFTVTGRAIPSGGAQVTLTGVITELQDASLGSESSIGISSAGSQAQIEQVTSGAI
tara:strand:- start:2466 stop:3359 length:894 start_codon:yes stop_codon:yes gene_type:complete